VILVGHGFRSDYENRLCFSLRDINGFWACVGIKPNHERKRFWVGAACGGHRQKAAQATIFDSIWEWPCLTSPTGKWQNEEKQAFLAEQSVE